MALRLLEDDDYTISLTDSQKESFVEIFKVILEPGEEEIPLELFSTYVCREAQALGSQIEHEQFMTMIDESGIDDDGDGSLTEAEFLSFLRGLFLANIPSLQIEPLREAYDAAVAEAPNEPMDEARVQILFSNLGFDVGSSGWKDVMGVIDADGDGDVDFSEFLTGIGMMKQFILLSTQLSVAFSDYKEQSTQKRRISNVMNSSNMGRGPQKERFGGLGASLVSKSMRKIPIPQDLEESDRDADGAVELDAADLEAFLAIPRDEAEEMIFLADQDEVEAIQNEQGSEGGGSLTAHRTIDREEFQQLLRMMG